MISRPSVAVSRSSQGMPRAVARSRPWRSTADSTSSANSWTARRPWRQADAQTTATTRAAATRDAVVASLSDHTWLHFCGHGAAEPATASGSRLLVHDHLDHPLTVAGVSRLDLPSAELAYLSACTTARSGFTAMDEALHLAGGLHLAGFRHVLGSLWEIDDTVARRVAERAYAGLGAPEPVADRAAHALHDAVRETRDRYRATPSLWAAYIHVGT